MTSTHPPEEKRPTALRIAHWLFTAAAVVMALYFLAVTFAGPALPEGPQADFFRENWTFLGYANLVAALILASFSPQLLVARKHSRTVLAATVFVLCFIDLAAVVVAAGGYLFIAIVVILLGATVAMFRPSANDFFRAHNRPRL